MSPVGRHLLYAVTGVVGPVYASKRLLIRIVTQRPVDRSPANLEAFHKLGNGETFVGSQTLYGGLLLVR